MKMNETKNSSLREMINQSKLMRSAKMTNNQENIHALYQHFTHRYEKKSFKPLIFAWNANRIDKKKFGFLLEIVFKYHPDILFVSECWLKTNHINGYTAIVSNDVYQNHLYIKADKLRNRNITTTECGFLVEDIAFRYIPPKYSNEFRLLENEIGDFNFKSHLWINHKNFKKEIKDFGIGGMGCKLRYDNTTKFIEAPSDHKAILIQINEDWKKTFKVDHRKLENALNNCLITGKLDYIYSDVPIKNIRFNSRMLNPNAIDFDQWEEVYGNKPRYIPHMQHIIGNSPIDKSFGTNAYDAHNLPLKPITKFIADNKLGPVQIQQIVNATQKFPTKSRIVTILKKDHKLKDIRDIRPISILPVAMRITEATRNDLTKLPTNKRIFSFKPGLSIHNLFECFFGDFNFQ